MTGTTVSVLFTCDTVDHNILTIDGKGTFHPWDGDYCCVNSDTEETTSYHGAKNTNS